MTAPLKAEQLRHVAAALRAAAEATAHAADVLAGLTGEAASMPKSVLDQDLRDAAVPVHGATYRIECRAVAEAWMRHRVASWPSDAAPPSIAADWAAARRDELATSDGRPVSRRYVRDARWPGWQRTPGRPRKSAEK